jgi:hypothetical protein
MKYKGYTIIMKTEGFQIFGNSLTIGWAKDLEAAKAHIDNMFVTNFA